MSASLEGKYVYSTKKIGKGAFSQVFKGFNIKTDQLVAVKVIEKDSLKKSMLQRIESEIGLMKSLEHQNIIKLMDYFTDEEKHYLVLEYCGGGDLFKLLKKGRLLLSKAQDYTKQLARGLEYLRSRNILHRDLKPQNILLTADLQTIKITDFDFARELWDTDLAETLCGSPLYMAPEITSHMMYNSKSDLWSVGIIIYEMVYGFSPYEDALNHIDLLKKIKTREIHYDSTVDDECNELLEKLLQKDYKKRIDWKEFFSHPWISQETANLMESLKLSGIGSVDSFPSSSLRSSINFTLIDEYTPPSDPSFSPPRTKNIFKIKEPRSERRNYIPASAPQPGLADHLMSGLSMSVGAIKGAVSYLSQ